MSSINNPDIDPANNYSLVGVINFAVQKILQSQNGMLPAKVIAYDRTKNRATVQVLINLVTTDNQQVSRPQLQNIPVVILGAGAFSISFPLQPGDLGWLLANDRDISLFLQNLKQNPPNTFRMNDFAAALFIPDIMKSNNITDTNEDYLIVQSNDGSMSISMGIDAANTNAPSVNITAGRVNITANSGTGYTIINGNLWVSGLIQTTTGAPISALPVLPPYPP